MSAVPLYYIAFDFPKHPPTQTYQGVTFNPLAQGAPNYGPGVKSVLKGLETPALAKRIA